MPLLQHYKAFVKQHPALVLNAERLLHWVAWNPERFSGSEYAYEAFNAAVGLLGIYNESILADTPEYSGNVAQWALWLAAVEQVQTLVELRAIQLEQQGKMSRYGPLMVLELVKLLLRLRLWQSSKCSLALESVSREDQEQHECEQQLKELLQALTRLRQRHSYEPMAAPTAEQRHWQEQLQRQQAVRAAAVAPNRPPAACAAGELARCGSLSIGSSSSSSSGGAVAAVVPGLSWLDSAGSSSCCRCPECGAPYSSRQAALGSSSVGSSSSSTGVGGTTEQQQQCCQSCGSMLPVIQQQQQQHNAAAQESKEVAEVKIPAGNSNGSRLCSATACSGSKLSKGWWQRITSLYPGSKATGAAAQQQGAGREAAAAAGALPGSWGPGWRQPYNPNTNSDAHRSQRTRTSSSGAALFSFPTSRQQQLLLGQHNPWCLCNRDDGIGHSVMWVGELVHLLRPLLYVTLLKRYGLGSWKPWLLSLALDLASGYGLHTGHAILTHSNASKWPPGSTLYSLALLRSLSSNRWSPGEQAELLGRKAQLLRYLLRSPCYDAVTRRLLQKVVAGSRWMPGVSNLAEFAFSMVEGMQSYYTYVEC